MTDELRKETERLLAMESAARLYDPGDGRCEAGVKIDEGPCEACGASQNGQCLKRFEVPSGLFEAELWNMSAHIRALQSELDRQIAEREASPRPAPPERKDISDDEFFSLSDKEYWKRMGWNAAIDAMLSAAPQPPAPAVDGERQCEE